jgi:aspartyl-tRNA(Asn)/glutamyl-tRNA(Gln) amidotransferase subunit C
MSETPVKSESPARGAAIDREQVLKVAKLARLTLRDDEVPVVTAQLSKVLEHIAQLSEVDTTGIEPTAQVGVDRLPLRPDVPHEPLSREVVFAQAPEIAGGGFVVPSFVEE